jgi:hypothetical protein
MLVENEKFKKGDTISIKLMSGEELVGSYVSESSDTFNLDKPFKLIQTSEKNYGFAPVMVTTDPNKIHSIFKNSIVIVTETYVEIKTQYKDAVNAIPAEGFTEVSKKDAE